MHHITLLCGLCVVSCTNSYFLTPQGFLWCYVPAKHTMWVFLSSANNYRKSQDSWTADVIWVTLQVNPENHSPIWLLSSGLPFSLSHLSHSFLKGKSLQCSFCMAPVLMFQPKGRASLSGARLFRSSAFPHSTTLNFNFKCCILNFQTKLHCFYIIMLSSQPPSPHCKPGWK